MLMGKFKHSLDAKGRIILPSKFREEIGDSFIVTLGFDNCLAVYPAKDYLAFVERLSKLPQSNPATRVVRDRFIGNAHQCEADKQGRFVVPTVLKEFAKLDHDIEIVGDIDKVYIWDVAEHEAYLGGEKAMSTQEATDKLNSEGFYF